ncbi:MAG: AAA family ATPase [Betaproteobacteria bacterium]|nr:AAA family ATPase [Betaproteobacteria bacterium]
MSNNTENIVLNQLVTEEKIPVSIYQNIKSPQGKQFEITWEKFCEKLNKPMVSDTKDVMLFSPTRLNATKLRANANVVEVSMLVFDIDDPKGKTLNQIIDLVSNQDCIVHSTWSHTPDKPRYRLIIRLSESISSEHYRKARDNFLFFNPELSTIIDKACSDIARAYYLFSYPEDRSQHAVFIINKGNPVKISDYLIRTYSPTLTKTDTKINFSTDNVMEGSRNVALTKYLGGIIGQGKDYQESLSLAISWNASLADPLDEVEVTRTHQSIWKTHQKNHPVVTNLNLVSTHITSVNRQFSLVAASDLLASPPPPRKWLINDFLPKKIVAAIIAAGGTGKSFLAMHIAVALAAGNSLFCKFIINTASKVVFISGEDDSEELQRRIHAVTRGLPTNLIESIKNNIHFIDLADSLELFTCKPISGEVSMTDVPVNLVKTIKEKLGDEVDLVIVDPVSRFRGGEENSAGDTTRFVQALQYIRDHLNASVLTLHHVNKGAKSNGATQNNARGSSAFIDGVRLVYELNTISEDEIKKQYGASDIIPKLVTLSCVKSNYGKHIEPLTLAKKIDGSLELFAMQRGQQQKLAILQEIKVSQLTKTQFKQNYGGVGSKFGLAEKALISKLSEFEKEGLLTIPNRGIMVLTKIGESLLIP